MSDVVFPAGRTTTSADSANDHRGGGSNPPCHTHLWWPKSEFLDDVGRHILLYGLMGKICNFDIKNVHLSAESRYGFQTNAFLMGNQDNGKIRKSHSNNCFKHHVFWPEILWSGHVYFQQIDAHFYIIKIVDYSH